MNQPETGKVSGLDRTSLFESLVFYVRMVAGCLLVIKEVILQIKKNWCQHMFIYIYILIDIIMWYSFEAPYNLTMIFVEVIDILRYQIEDPRMWRFNWASVRGCPLLWFGDEICNLLRFDEMVRRYHKMWWDSPKLFSESPLPWNVLNEFPCVDDDGVMFVEGQISYLPGNGSSPEKSGSFPDMEDLSCTSRVTTYSPLYGKWVEHLFTYNYNQPCLNAQLRYRTNFEKWISFLKKAILMF